MNELVRIGNQEISTKEYNGQRVVTLKDIDTVHERPEGTARKRFNDNKKRFVENEDFIEVVEPSEIRTLGLERPQGGVPEKVILITEQGYLMLVKSFTDDLAWKVQRQLVNTYFRTRKPLSQLEILQQSIEVLNRHDKELKQMDGRMNKLEFDIPLYGSEADELSKHVKRKGVEVLGGKQSEAYKDKKIRDKVYKDIYNEIKREFDVYDDDGKTISYKALKRKYLTDAHKMIDSYTAPYVLAETIANANAQMQLRV